MDKVIYIERNYLRISAASVSLVLAGNSFHLVGMWRSFLPLLLVEQERRGHLRARVLHQQLLHTRELSSSSSWTSPSWPARSLGTARELSTVDLQTTQGCGALLTKTKMVN